MTAIAQDSLHINANLMLKSIYDADDKPNSAALCLERLLLAKPEDVKKRRELADSHRQQREVMYCFSERSIEAMPKPKDDTTGTNCPK